MRCLITGHDGFVGRHVKRYLESETDWEVITHFIDLTMPLPESLGQFDYIINLASIASVEYSVVEPVKTIRNNVELMLNLLEFARKHPPKAFLHLSTVEIYNVTNPYAASKVAQEEIINAYWKSYDVPALILRSSNIIGEGQSKDKFVPKLVEQIKAGETVRIYTSGGKVGRRIYNPVGNVVDAIVFLLGKYPKKHEPGYQDFPTHFDITGGENLTNLEMAKRVAELTGKPLKYELFEPKQIIPAYARRLPEQGVKLSKLGWKPPHKIDEALLWIKP